jgi:hypothetical protein
MSYVWHYTHLANLAGIERNGLRPRQGYPLIWFTANQVWEPLARALEGSGKLPEQLRRGSERAARLGLPECDKRLMTMSEVFGSPSPGDQAQWWLIERAAKSLGSDPLKEWRVAFAERIPFCDLIAQRLQRGVWVDRVARPGEVQRSMSRGGT